MTKKENGVGTVMVIGASGFIGRSVCRTLVGKGFRVVALCRSDSGLHDLSGTVPVVGAQDDRSVLESWLPICDAVIHAASDSTPGTTDQQPVLEVDLNLSPSLRFLEVLMRFPDCKLIYISSAGAIYAGDALCGEAAKVLPRSCYGAGKLAFESFLIALGQSSHVKSRIIRPTNVYGPGQPVRANFGIIPMLMHHALNETEIEIWGDGNNKRDFLYVDDLSSLCELLVLRPWTDANEIYNAASDSAVSLRALLDMVEQVSERTIRSVHRPARGVDPGSVLVSAVKARGIGWSPKTTLMAGLAETWKHFTAEI